MTVKPDLVAPGTHIVSLRVPTSTMDRMMPSARVDANRLGASPPFEPRYMQMSGSSMATAVVSGSVALMLEAQPHLTPDEVKARLMRGAARLDGEDIYSRGAGALDLARAPDTRRAFESMARLATQLAAALEGRIVDDNGSALDERAIAAIAQQLDSVRAQLEARGLAPGSPAALRLFS